MFQPEGKYEARFLKEGASKTFKKGALVVFASGYIAEAGADPALILGVSMSAGHNSAAGTDSIMVALAHDANTFVAEVKGTGAANNSAQTDVGTAYGVVNSGGIWYVDKDDTANTRVMVIGLVDIAGTANGRVLLKFLSANRYF